MGGCRGAHLFALRVWARTAQTSARTAQTCGPDRPDMWPGHVARTARTCGPDSLDMWPGQPGLWPGCQPIMASARVAMFPLAGEGRLAGQPGQVARTARTGGPDSPDGLDMWPGQPGHAPRTARSFHGLDFFALRGLGGCRGAHMFALRGWGGVWMANV